MAYDQGITEFIEHEFVVQSFGENMFILHPLDPFRKSSVSVSINGIVQGRSSYDVGDDVLAFKPGIVLVPGDVVLVTYAL